MQKKRKITIASAKAKGRKLQKIVAQKIAEIFKKTCGYGDDDEIKIRIMGQKGVDIIFDNETEKKFPFSIECKNQERININQAIMQSEKNKKNNTNWLLVIKNKKLKNPVVLLEIDAFLNLFKEKEKGIKV